MGCRDKCCLTSETRMVTVEPGARIMGSSFALLLRRLRSEMRYRVGESVAERVFLAG